MAWQSYVKDSYQAGDGSIVIRGRLSKPATDRLIVLLHGRTAGFPAQIACTQFAIGGTGSVQVSAAPLLIYLAEHGYTIMSIDASGNLHWGNPASVTAISNAISYARTQGYCHPTAKVGFMGYSMGNLASLNYLNSVGQSGVAGIISVAGAYNIDTFHSDSTYTSEIDTAYPSGYTSSNPTSYASSITVPTRIFHDSGDTTVPISESQNLLAALGSSDKSLMTLSGDHNTVWAYIDPQTTLSWLGSLSW